MDIFSKLKDTVQGHIPSKAGNSPDLSSSSKDAGIDDILKSDPTSDVSMSSKVLEASENADYSGGLGVATNTPLNPPNQIVRDTPPMDSSMPPMPSNDPLASNPMPPVGQQPPVASSEIGLDSTINQTNPTQNAYPSDQTAMAQAAYPSIQTPTQGVMPQQPQSQPIQPSAAIGGVPEYPQPPTPVSDIQQSNTDGMRKLDISLELRGLKDQINLIIEKLNVIEERTRRFSY
ncbi:MAG: hypothetical protein GQ477_01570 [Nanohaloarchaea archaeon]|nr:hypothetical protein [Candidatus Nanohaloarchaea archaeon]